MPGLSTMLERCALLRQRLFVRSRALPLPAGVALSFVMAALTGLLAQVRVPLWFTPVPVTGQVFAVLLAGVLLGGVYGGLSQCIYVALGAAGLPWFSGFGGGLVVLAGPTGGYLVGFVLAAVLIGAVVDRHPAWRSFARLVVLMLAGVAVIYGCGALHLAIFSGLSAGRALALGVAPFVAVDVVKAVAAAAVASALLPADAAGAADT